MIKGEKMNEIEVIELEGKEYYLIKKIKVNGFEYYILINTENNKDLIIRRLMKDKEEEFLVKLIDEEEYNSVMEKYMNNGDKYARP